MRRQLGKAAVLAVAAALLVAFGAAAQTTIIYQTYASDVELEQARLARFHAAHPDIRVELHYLSSSDAHRDALRARIAGGVPPDVIYSTETVEEAAQGILMPLDSFLSRDGYDVLLQRDLAPGLYDWDVYQGKHYGIPFNQNITGIFYRKALLAGAGVAEPSRTWTWDDLSQNLKALTRSKPDGTLEAAMYFPDNPGYWMAFASTNGGGTIATVEGPTIRPRSAGPENIAALEYLLKGYSSGQIQTMDQYKALSIRALIHLMGNGKTYADWEKEWGGFVALPRRVRNRVMASPGSYAMVKTANPKRQEAAWTFLKWLIRPENTFEYLALRGYFPASRSAFEYGPYQDLIRREPVRRIIFEESFSNAFRLPNWVGAERYWRQGPYGGFRGAFTRILKGEISPREGLGQWDETMRVVHQGITGPLK